MRRVIACCAFALLGLLPGLLTAAATPEAFQQHYERAVSLYLSEHYQDSLKEFQAAYAARQLPRLLINIGTAYRKLGQAREALQAYEEYLKVEPNPAPEIKKKLQDCLAEARAMLDVASKTVGATGKPRPAPKKGVFSPFMAHGGATVSVKGALRAIAGNGPDDFFIAGVPPDTGGLRGPTIHHFDGKALTPVYGGFGGDLRRIVSLSPKNLWAVGTHGLILHFDGEGWHKVESGTEKNLIGVWATAGGAEMWAMDEGGGVLRFDGTDWVEQPADPPEGVSLFGFYAIGDKNALGVGVNGAVVRWDGTQVVAMASATKSTLFSVWASSSTNAWAVGQDGVILHYDGSGWVSMPSGTTKALFGVYGVSPNEVYAVGGSWEQPYEGIILRWNGKKWVTVLPTTRDRLRAVYGDAGAMFAIGENGRVLRSTPTRGWSEDPRRTDKDLWAVVSRGAGDVWAVGQGGAILRLDATANNAWSAAFSRTSDAINGLFRVGPQDFWAAGDSGTLLRWNGHAWSRSPSGTTENLRSVWASGDREAFAVGTHGTVRHFDGTSWTASPSGISDDLTAVWGSGPRDVFAVGESGTVLHYDGRSWSRQPSGYSKETNRPSLGALWGSGDKDIWLAGSYGFLSHNDGSGWKAMATKNIFVLSGLWGSGPRDVWAVGTGVAMHYDGKSWTISPAGTSGSLNAVYGFPGKASEILAVDGEGAVVHKAGHR